MERARKNGPWMERLWLMPAIAVTVSSALIAAVLIPDSSGLLPALMILPSWMALAALIAAISGFALLAVRKVESPFAAIAEALSQHRTTAIFVTLGMLLAGLNMIAFMWVKPTLNYLVPFWADPLLARLDNLLFLGRDPWHLLHGFNFPMAGLVYHQVWFGMMIAALLLALVQPPSPKKSAVLLSYFLLWSVIGPLIHIILPATGPIFYERMGYGDRFGGLSGGEETRMVGDYLWGIYASKSFGAGAGISAMPSMHVTIVSWIVIVVGAFARRWLWLALAGAALIFVLSMSLGWHYALDGIVGAAAAGGCYAVLRMMFGMWQAKANSAPPAGIPV